MILVISTLEIILESITIEIIIEMIMIYSYFIY